MASRRMGSAANPRSSQLSLGNFDEGYPVSPNRQCQLAVLQRESVFAKDIITPTEGRRDRGPIVCGDRFQILGGGHQPLRNLVLFTSLLQ